SPLLGGVLAGGGTPVAYRGAFSGPTDDWADGWTALSQYGYLKAAEIGTPVAPALAAGLEAGNHRMTFFGVNGVSYRVESSPDLGAWSPMGGGNGSAIGAGQNITLTFPAGTGTRFFRVRTQ
ncbi:MAG: hypothetical protein ACXW3L_07365, partial [Limisphaerales bacterium]